ncbi:type III-B CRISPR module RAMP protein Cmr6 [Serratia microhaemolytica]|uniref:type III-B CRISPR module RAMP protein Cmr6 n=1 Tax=Serratia microhaemolytica TaxID=2675110 RepID=UPI000FDDB98C|nr:type III-B CRISPR module RAMP protein Cmr6 [Serratia microhaemolytica]
MIPLVREKINKGFGNTNNANPGLLLQKGLPEVEDNNSKNSDAKSANNKTEYLNKLVEITAFPEYQHAFNRWFDITSDANRFQQAVMTLENRLLIALSGNGALETGCSLSHNYGMPYIPGSSVKGVARAWASQHLAAQSRELEALFGTDESEQLHRVSGLVTFHDAWWIPPQKAAKPFVLDVVTTHHQDYYNGSQDEPSDKDSPIPNHLLAVTGSFLFVLEGERNAVELCQILLQKALVDNGIGAKTAAGYGYMKAAPTLMQHLLAENEKRLPAEVREQRQADAKRLIEQQTAAAEKAELEKPPLQIIDLIDEEYKRQRDDQDFRRKVEAWIDRAIDSWSIDDRKSLASCLKNVGYIPGNKKKNYQINKERLQKLRGE